MTRISQTIFLFFLSTTNCSADGHTEASKCAACVDNEESSWQNGECQTSVCPIMDVVCCTSVDCCVTEGCRSPENQHWVSSGSQPLQCTTCCGETNTVGLCQNRTFVTENGTVPYYNLNEVYDCKDELDPTCPPCAACTLTEEEQIESFREQNINGTCSAERCEEEKGITYIMNPCESDPQGCGCFCQSVTPLLDYCLHLKDNFYTEQNIPEEDPMETDPDETSACNVCVEMGGGWQGQCETNDCPLMDIICCTSKECCATIDTKLNIPEEDPVEEYLDETSACNACVERGRGWQVQCGTNDCPLMDIICCTSEECCATIDTEIKSAAEDQVEMTIDTKLKSAAEDPIDTSSCIACVKTGGGWQVFLIGSWVLVGVLGILN